MMTQQARILLVDDEEVFRLSTVALLERAGYVCDHASDSEEASRRLSDSYDALISDIRMPGNHQMEFLRDVRQRYSDLPILVLTGYPSLDTVLSALRLSCVDYLLKPVEWPEMAEAVSQAVKKGQSLRTFREAQARLSDVEASLSGLEQALQGAGPARGVAGNLNWTLEQFLAQSALRLKSLMTKVQLVANGTIAGHVSEPVDVCEFMRCPRKSAYEEAVHETIDVLERTKHAFKSKDLGELRRKLELLLKTDLP